MDDQKIDNIFKTVIDNKISLTAIKKDVEANTRDLGYHIRRTDNLENYLHDVDKKVTRISVTIALVTPIITTVLVKLAGKFIV
jgi:hypothetical protein